MSEITTNAAQEMGQKKGKQILWCEELNARLFRGILLTIAFCRLFFIFFFCSGINIGQEAENVSDGRAGKN